MASQKCLHDLLWENGGSKDREEEEKREGCKGWAVSPVRHTTTMPSLPLLCAVCLTHTHMSWHVNVRHFSLHCLPVGGREEEEVAWIGEGEGGREAWAWNAQEATVLS